MREGTLAVAAILMGSALAAPTAWASPSGYDLGRSSLIVPVQVEEFRSNVSASRAWLGVQIQTLTPELAARMGVKDAKGAVVGQVVENSPAQRAGFAQGDIITAVNGTAVEEARVLTREVAALKAGEEARFTVLRDGATRTLKATVGDASRVASDDTPAANVDRPWLGVQIQDLTPELATRMGVKGFKGALVGQIVENSPAQRAGFAQGDIITAVNGTAVEEARILTREVAALKAGEEARFTVVRDGATRTLIATIGAASRVASNDTPSTNVGVDRPWLGVQIQDLTPELATSMGVKDTKGALVAEVVENSPAERAGFTQGDIITAVNGTAVEEGRGVTREVAALKAGAEASFTIMRDGARRTLTATIETRAADQAASVSQQPEGRPATGIALAGVTLAAIDPALRTQYHLPANAAGAVVTAVDAKGDAAMKGLKPGDVIKRVGSRPVQTLADVERGLEDAKQVGRGTVAALVTSEQGQRFVALSIVQG